MQNDKKKQYKISKGETKLSLLVNAIFLEKQENQSTIQTRAAGWNKDHLEKKKVMISNVFYKENIFVYYVIKIKASFFKKTEKGLAGKRSLKVIFSGIPSSTTRTKKGLNTSVVPSLLLLSRFSRVRLCATPQTAAHLEKVKKIFPPRAET